MGDPKRRFRLLNSHKGALLKLKTILLLCKLFALAEAVHDLTTLLWATLSEVAICRIEPGQDVQMFAQ